MPDPLRKQILDALEAKLETITVANGYVTQLVTVVMEAFDWDDIDPSLMPWIGYVPGEAVPHPELSSFGTIYYVWPIELLVHQMADDNTPSAASDANTAIRRDIRRALYATNPSVDVDGVIEIRMGSDIGNESAPESHAEARASSVVTVEVHFEESNTS